MTSETTGPREVRTRGNSLTSKPTELKWALPQSLEIPPDKLKARVDIYSNSVMLYLLNEGVITCRHVSADNLATAVLSVAALSTGILPEGALWYVRKETHAETAVYLPPHKRRLSVMMGIDKPDRYNIPLPPLVFITSPGQAPRVYAVKHRPGSAEDMVYKAPLFNVYEDGRTCAGTQQYSNTPKEIIEEFFISFFSLHLGGKHSKSHPDSLIALWKELDGKDEYPLDDLIPYAKVEKIL